MAPIRITSTLQRRRRSSLALNPFTPAKPGLYGINRPVTFAPNITPVTFTEPEDGADMDNLSSILSSPDSDSSPAAIFPPSVDDASSALGMTTTRKRCPPGKRRSQGYIPRPPNAFMLFRADFVRQKHVPGSIETNHGSLSKIIGNCWRALPLDEKRIWEVKAKHAKAEHKARYPNYRFRPVHNKNKDGKKKEKEKNQTAVDDERRCEEVAQLLLEGKKGEELAAAIRDLDGMRSQTPPAQQQQQQQQHYYPPRRPSSVPLPNDYFTYFPNIALPSLASFPSRPASPVSISQQQQQQRQRGLLGARRPSSAGPTMMERSWTMPAFNTMGTVHNHQMMFQQDFQRDFHTPLPDADESLFNFSWSSSGAVMSSSSSTDHSHQQLLQAPIPISSHHGLDNLGPLGETLVAPMQILPPGASDVASEMGMSWMQMGLESLDACSQLNSLDSSISKPSSIYSSSPEPADDVLLAHQQHHQHQYQQQQQQQQNMYHPESYAGQDLFSGFNNTSGLDALFAADDSQQACFDPTAATLSILHHHPAGHQHNALYDFVHE